MKKQTALFVIVPVWAAFLIIAWLLMTSGVAYSQARAAPIPLPEIQFLNVDGSPLAGAKLCTYKAGTSTPLATFTDSTATTANTNPVTLDSYGRASVWVGKQAYKYVLIEGGDPGDCSTGTIHWTQDNVTAAPGIITGRTWSSLGGKRWRDL